MANKNVLPEGKLAKYGVAARLEPVAGGIGISHGLDTLDASTSAHYGQFNNTNQATYF